MQIVTYSFDGTLGDACRFCNQHGVSEHVFQMLIYGGFIYIIFRVTDENAPALRKLLGLPNTANPPLIANPFTSGL